jgi:hypothetical protein
MKHRIAAIVCLLAIGSVAAETGAYVGIDAALPYGATWKDASGKSRRVSTGVAAKPTVGYRFDERYALEAQYLNIRAEEGSRSETLQVVPIHLVYSGALSQNSAFTLKGGLAPFSARYTDGNNRVTGHYVGLSLGVGLQTRWSTSVSGVVGLDFLNGFRARINNETYDISPANAYAGVRLAF